MNFMKYGNPSSGARGPVTRSNFCLLDILNCLVSFLKLDKKVRVKVGASLAKAINKHVSLML